MKKMLLAGMAVLALGSGAHAAEQQKLYCYEAGGKQQRVTFTRDANTVYMHNEIDGKDYKFPIKGPARRAYIQRWLWFDVRLS
jgi:hypothetical protein